MDLDTGDATALENVRPPPRPPFARPFLRKLTPAPALAPAHAAPVTPHPATPTVTPQRVALLAPPRVALLHPAATRIPFPPPPPPALPPMPLQLALAASPRTALMLAPAQNAAIVLKQIKVVISTHAVAASRDVTMSSLPPIREVKLRFREGSS